MSDLRPLAVLDFRQREGELPAVLFYRQKEYLGKYGGEVQGVVREINEQALKKEKYEFER
ncbi:MAG TPA: hypothetical protein GX687_06125 [Clostridia bacterium]|nr:hypothetical protein [Clostridia bacterium]